MTVAKSLTPELQDILSNWDINFLQFLKQAESGLLNKTYLLRSKDSELFVLQNIHPAVAMDGAIKNYYNITEFLHSQGQVVQGFVITKENQLWCTDKRGQKWRLLKGVEGQVFTKTSDPKLANEAGRLLASLHSSLKSYPHSLDKGRVSHDYHSEFTKFKKLFPQLETDPNPKVSAAAKLISETLPTLTLPDNLPQTIIHADPKVSNFLFTTNNIGICMIDFDTLQVLSPLYELGDAIRSWCGGDEDDPNNTFNKEVFNSLIQSYKETAPKLLSTQEELLIPQAGQLIMLGLAMRFINDYIEDSYFGWDETKYETRKDHNLARCLGQIALYKSFINIL